MWIDPSVYVWRASEGELGTIVEVITYKTSPIIIVGGLYGVGKSTFINAFEYLVGLNAKNSKFVKVPVRKEKSSEFAFLKNIADELGLRDKRFGGHYPRDSYEILTAILNELRAMSKQHGALALIVDDTHMLGPEAYMAIKAICDLAEEGKRLCPVILCGEYTAIETELSKGKLVQLKERAQERVLLRPFSEIEVLELVARAMTYARGAAKDNDWKFDPATDMGLISPFTPASIRVVFDSLKGLPRYIKPACRVAARRLSEQSDGLTDTQKYQVTAEIMKEAVEEAKARRGDSA